MRLLYNSAIAFYGALIRLASLLGNSKARQWIEGRRDWQTSLEAVIRKKGGDWLWFHCASLGEFEQGRPLIEALRSKYPRYRILLTFYSPSGYAVRKDYSGADHVAYLPLDTPAASRTFIELVQPKAAFFIKYEFWLNTLSALSSRRVPVYLVSGIFRPGQIFFRWYGKAFREALGHFETLFLQDEYSLGLLKNAGIPEDKMIVAGDTRFDRVTALASGRNTDPQLVEWCGSDRVLVAGSTWPEDEHVLLPALADQWTSAIRIVIAPHEIHEAAVAACINRLKAAFGEDAVVRYTQLKETPKAAARRVLVLDTMGQLSSAYRCASIAYIGGGFGKGIHNILEAAVWGVPIIFGPNHARFREANELIRTGGAQAVRSVDGLSDLLRHYLIDDHARRNAGAHAADYVRNQRGATERILFHLNAEVDGPFPHQ